MQVVVRRFVHAVAGSEVEAAVVFSHCSHVDAQVVGFLNNTLCHVDRDEAETRRQVGRLAIHADTVDLLVLQGTVLQACDVVDVIIEVHEVDVAVVVYQNQALGLSTVGQMAYLLVVEVVEAVVGLHRGVLVVVAQQVIGAEGVGAQTLLGDGQDIDLLPDGHALLCYPI